MITNDFLKSLKIDKIIKRKMNYMILILMLSACGGHHHSGGDSSSSSSAKSKVTSNAASSSSDFARLVDTVSDLGVCDSLRFGQLFYVQEISQFFFCAKTNSQWSAVDLRGPKGDVGAQGINGKDGATTKALEANEWADPVSDLEWIVGASMTRGNAITSTVELCTSGLRYATQQEASDAISHGIMQKLSTFSLNGFFIVGNDLADNGTGSDFVTIMDSSTGAFSNIGVSGVISTQHNVLCIKQ